MREGNVSQRHGIGLDNGDRVEYGYGAERNGGTVGDRLRQWHIEGRRRGDGSERSSVDARQNSRGWAGSGAKAEGHGNRKVKVEERRRSHHHPSSILSSIVSTAIIISVM